MFLKLSKDDDYRQQAYLSLGSIADRTASQQII